MKRVYHITRTFSEQVKMSKNNNVRRHQDRSNIKQLTRELLAELLGTYMLLVSNFQDYFYTSILKISLLVACKFLDK